MLNEYCVVFLQIIPDGAQIDDVVVEIQFDDASVAVVDDNDACP